MAGLWIDEALDEPFDMDARRLEDERIVGTCEYFRCLKPFMQKDAAISGGRLYHGDCCK